MEAVKQKSVQDLYDVRVQLTESARTSYFVTIPAETAYKDILKPEYWKHVCKKFGRFTRIELTTDDQQYYAELLVLDTGPTWAVVKELSYHDLNNIEIIKAAEKHAEYEMKWRGPHYKWSVLRKSDSAVIKEQFEQKNQAALFLQEYIRTINR